jgi:hypothetical protein
MFKALGVQPTRIPGTPRPSNEDTSTMNAAGWPPGREGAPLSRGREDGREGEQSGTNSKRLHQRQVTRNSRQSHGPRACLLSHWPSPRPSPPRGPRGEGDLQHHSVGNFFSNSALTSRLFTMSAYVATADLAVRVFAASFATAYSPNFISIPWFHS